MGKLLWRHIHHLMPKEAAPIIGVGHAVPKEVAMGARSVLHQCSACTVAEVCSLLHPACTTCQNLVHMCARCRRVPTCVFCTSRPTPERKYQDQTKYTSNPPRPHKNVSSSASLTLPLPKQTVLEAHFSASKPFN